MINVNSRVEVLLSTGARKTGVVVQFLGSGYYAVQPDDGTEQIYTSEAFITVLEAASEPSQEQRMVASREVARQHEPHPGPYCSKVRDLGEPGTDGYKAVELADVDYGLVCDNCRADLLVGDTVWTTDNNHGIYCNACHTNGELPEARDIARDRSTGPIGADEEVEEDEEDEDEADMTRHEVLDGDARNVLGWEHVRITHLGEYSYNFCSECDGELEEGETCWWDEEGEDYYCEACARARVAAAVRQHAEAAPANPAPAEAPAENPFPVVRAAGFDYRRVPGPVTTQGQFVPCRIEQAADTVVCMRCRHPLRVGDVFFMSPDGFSYCTDCTVRMEDEAVRMRRSRSEDAAAPASQPEQTEQRPPLVGVSPAEQPAQPAENTPGGINLAEFGVSLERFYWFARYHGVPVRLLSMTRPYAGFPPMFAVQPVHQALILAARLDELEGSNG